MQGRRESPIAVFYRGDRGRSSAPPSAAERHNAVLRRVPGLRPPTFDSTVCEQCVLQRLQGLWAEHPVGRELGRFLEALHGGLRRAAVVAVDGTGGVAQGRECPL